MLSDNATLSVARSHYLLRTCYRDINIPLIHIDGVLDEYSDGMSFGNFMERFLSKYTRTCTKVSQQMRFYIM